MPAIDKIMFEVYRESSYNQRYNVVYFTELDDHNKDQEIDAAMMGDHYFDGFIRSDKTADAAKEVIESVIERLNSGEQVDPSELERSLSEYSA